MSAARVQAGDVLDDKYRVERVLGAGGMGMVVAARHIHLGQRVALKFMLKEAMSDRANAERFAREARAAVRLQSQHTARVLDVGKLKNGEPYMVMEYLEGQDLDEVVQRNGPMPPPVAVDYILQACEAFAEAHSLGMIHRDIKPKNLFLTKTVDGRPLVKVLDFGLAKTVGQMGDVSLTATSAVFGSPQYMSPEQMKSAKDVDTRSDIWSLGVSLYELLTGRVPFDGGGLAEICAMVLKDPVDPPSKWVNGIPAELEAVVVKCLAKDPAQRYQTVAELAFALEPWAVIEGSAKRVLQVMQTVQKTDMPTIINVGTTPVDAAVRTVDAWDTGGATRPTRRRQQPVMIALGGFGLLGVIGLVAIVSVAVSSKKSAPAAGSSTIDPTPASAAIAPDTTPASDPPPATATSGTVIGASPMTTASATTTAQPASPATAVAAGAAAPTPPATRQTAAAPHRTAALPPKPPPPTVTTKPVVTTPPKPPPPKKSPINEQ